jgi:hypothetical protein
MLKSSIWANCALPGKGLITADEPVQIVAFLLSKPARIGHPRKQSKPAKRSCSSPGSLPDKRWDAVLRKGVTGYDGILEIEIAAPPDDCGSHGDHGSPCDIAFVGNLRLEQILAVG